MANANIYALMNAQLPEFIRTRYPVFCTFMKCYYKFLATRGFAEIKELQDIDATCRAITIGIIPWRNSKGNTVYYTDELGDTHLVYGWNKNSNGEFVFNTHTKELGEYNEETFDSSTDYRCSPIIKVPKINLKSLVGRTLIQKLPSLSSIRKRKKVEVDEDSKLLEEADRPGIIRAEIVGVDDNNENLLIRYVTKDRQFSSRELNDDGTIARIGSPVCVQTGESISDIIPEFEVIKTSTIPNVFLDNFRHMLDAENIFQGQHDMITEILKNIKDYYSVKGTERSIEFLLRVMCQAETHVKYPWEQTLMVSDGKWVQHYGIVCKVEDTAYIDNLINWFDRNTADNITSYIYFNNYKVKSGISKSFCIYKIERFNNPKNDHFVRIYVERNPNDKTTPEPYYLESITNFTSTSGLESFEDYFEGNIVYDVVGADVVKQGRQWTVGQIFKIGGKQFKTQFLNYDVKYTPWFYRKLAYLKRQIESGEAYRSGTDVYREFLIELKKQYPQEYAHIQDDILDVYSVDDYIEEAGQETHLDISPIMYGETGIASNADPAERAIIYKVTSVSNDIVHDSINHSYRLRGLAHAGLIQGGEYICSELTDKNFDENGDFIEYTIRDKSNVLKEPKNPGQDSPKYEQYLIDHAAWSVSEHYTINPLINARSEDINNSDYDAEIKLRFGLVSRDDGVWEKSQGMLSDNYIYMQDSFYFQKFAYDIVTSVRPEDYEMFVKYTHPAGTLKFFTYNKDDYYRAESTLEDEFVIKTVHIADIALILDCEINKVNKVLQDRTKNINDIYFKIFNKSLSCTIEDTSYIRSNVFQKRLGVLTEEAKYFLPTSDLDAIIYKNGLRLIPTKDYTIYLDSETSDRVQIKTNISLTPENTRVISYDHCSKSYVVYNREDIVDLNHVTIPYWGYDGQQTLMVFVDGKLISNNLTQPQIIRYDRYNDPQYGLSANAISFKYPIYEGSTIFAIVYDEPCSVYPITNIYRQTEIIPVTPTDDENSKVRIPDDIPNADYLEIYSGGLLLEKGKDYIIKHDSIKNRSYVVFNVAINETQLKDTFMYCWSNNANAINGTIKENENLSRELIEFNDDNRFNQFTKVILDPVEFDNTALKKFVKILYDTSDIEYILSNKTIKKFKDSIENIIYERVNIFNKELRERIATSIIRSNHTNKQLIDVTESVFYDRSTKANKQFSDSISGFKEDSNLELKKVLSEKINSLIDNQVKKTFKQLIDAVEFNSVEIRLPTPSDDHNVDDMYDSVVVRKSLDDTDEFKYRDYLNSKWIEVDPAPVKGSVKSDKLKEMWDNCLWYVHTTSDPEYEAEINNYNYGVAPNPITRLNNTSEDIDPGMSYTFGEEYT